MSSEGALRQVAVSEVGQTRQKMPEPANLIRYSAIRPVCGKLPDESAYGLLRCCAKRTSMWLAKEGRKRPRTDSKVGHVPKIVSIPRALASSCLMRCKEGRAYFLILRFGTPLRCAYQARNSLKSWMRRCKYSSVSHFSLPCFGIVVFGAN